MARTRITAGDWRGRAVLTPPSAALRPTKALVREALFNILGERTSGAAVVDLYAGAGTVGFEALSRGAASVTFVERDRHAAALITRTADDLGCAERCRVVCGDVLRWLRRVPAAAASADICYVDAPYRDDRALHVLHQLGEKPPSLVVLEHHRAREIPDTLGRLRTVRVAVYGLTRLTFMQRVDGALGDGTSDA